MQNKSIFECLDEFICIKNGYLVLKILVPFVIVVLLFLMLPISDENLLLMLAKSLQESNLWIPIVLTAVSVVIYFAIIYVQIRQGYLLSGGDLRRAIGTSLVYTSLCTFITYAALRSVSSDEITLRNIWWASFLLVIISLIGFGWSIPQLEHILKFPNYTDGRLAAKNLTNILKRVQSQSRSKREDVENFYKEAKNLCYNIENNLALEPEWAKGKMEEVKDALHTLLNEDDDEYKSLKGNEFMYFAEVCRGGMTFDYPKFNKAFNTLSDDWYEWQYKKPKKKG